jgi:hypothetical protein
MDVDVLKPLTPLSFTTLTGLSAAKPLVVPDGATHATICPSTQNVRWTQDGSTDPTASVGILLAKDTERLFSGNLTNLRFIEVTASATLNIQFYKA